MPSPTSSPDTNPEEVFWRERISQEILGERLALEIEQEAHLRRHTHPLALRAMETSSDIAANGL